MSEPKSFASLSPTLLARKGGARPAMRPQWQPLDAYSSQVPTPPLDDELEDLGWNDMGDNETGDNGMGGGDPVDEAGQPRSTVVPFGAPDEQLQQSPLTGGIPAVVRQRNSLAGHVASGSDHAPAPLIPLAAHRYARDLADHAAAAQSAAERRSALADGRRAAFTLRVDETRHLKLRLACTMQGRSAQQLVTEALDRLLDGMPELDDLAKRVRRR